MFCSKSSVRIVTAWLLLGAWIGVVPMSAAQQPGTLASSAIPATPQLSASLYDAPRIAALPQAAVPQQPDSTTAAAPTGAAPAPGHHVSRWVWIAIVAAAGVGIGAGVIAGNSQSGKTAATTTTATIGAGSGGITAGAPHFKLGSWK